MMKALLCRLLPENLSEILFSYERRSQLLLNLSLVVNLVYAVLKLGSGIYYHSFWMGALGIYYAVLGGLRFFLLHAIHRPNDQTLIYRRTAWLLNLLTLTMTGIFVQMVRENRAYDYPGVLIFAMAAWTFANVIVAAVNLIRRQKDENKVLAAARCVSFAGALMSILALQTALIARFGEDDVAFAQLMNALGGAGVTALLVTLSALMIARSSAWKSTDENALH
ncbi:MAG: hypothetical protein IJ083_06125 [Clostridia bacterium]|nr:hypothetical protein [Clostridia bacterium]